ncbi:uncharacterized protein N7477_005882 [Penicillium maclennaniae]|uniref:uncharacterized protein n=1 Tax=Penicillium maclennaniae TaxID=1343394 RepID=UPI00253F7D3C|nr:uncharacterized protein N7477_005882 [Penicillium maclennaniae]KAJ5670519.1 hypothetical protein N7477_005882 [Penicillium maclennaniae]
MESSKANDLFMAEENREGGEVMGVCEGYEGYTAEEEKAVLRKIDMVILPFVEQGTAAITSIKKQDPSANIDLITMDLMGLTSVVAAANPFLTLESALHGLVKNAGITATPFETTNESDEAQWQTNYLTGF